MRKLYVVFCLIVCSVFLLVGSGSQAQPTELNVATWGGSYRDSFDESIDYFEEKYNARVNFFIGDAPQMLVKARLGQVDVVISAVNFAIQGENEGLWAELDETKIPNMTNLYDEFKFSKYTVAKDFGDYVICYNDKYIDPPPTSWNDLWNPAYKNRVAMYQFLEESTLFLVLQQAQQHGGDVDNIKPGLDRLYELYQSGNLIGMVKSSAELQNLLRLEEAWIALLTNVRRKPLLDEGLDFIKVVRPEEGSFGWHSTINVVKQTKELDLAMKFVNYTLDPICQDIFMDNSYSPTVRNAKDVPPELEEVVVPKESIVKLFPSIDDCVKIVEYTEMWAKQWDEMIYQ